MAVNRYRRVVAIGDSFTEGMGDPREDGSLRGWADRVAEALATHARTEDGHPVRYANLAVRGRRIGPILQEQLLPTLALEPDLVTLNGGGNDLLRPNVDVDRVATLAKQAADRITAAGGDLLICSGADPSGHLPFGGVLRRRGALLTEAIRAWAEGMPGVIFVDNFSDTYFHDHRVWSADGLHLNARGHVRAAVNAVRALGLDPRSVPAALDVMGPAARHRASLAFYRDHMGPWIGRRLTGRSSGDGREAKRPALTPVEDPELSQSSTGARHSHATSRARGAPGTGA